VAHASGSRVGVLVSSSEFLYVDRVDCDRKIQTPTRNPDAWGTLIS